MKFEEPFIAWDGEGGKGRYVLLQSSKGHILWNCKGLHTKEMFELLLSAPKKAIHIWFSFGYDVTHLCKDIPLRRLQNLYRYHSIRWKGFSIFYIPRKQFGVTDLKTHRSFNSYDAWGFFQSSFLNALKEWKVPPPAIIRRGKAARSNMLAWSKRDLIAYNSAECSMLVELMNRLRANLAIARLPICRWDGAGACATAWCKRENVKRWFPRKEPPDEVVRTAYFGGRIDCSAVGTGRAFVYDLNSAYPAALCHAPDLSSIRWKHRTNLHALPSPEWSLVHVRWRLPRAWPCDKGTPRFWNPLPWRAHDDSILYPNRGEGWYYTCEVAAADRRFGTLWRNIIEAWVPKDMSSLKPAPFGPLASAIQHDYTLRSQWKENGNPAQIPLRLALNALYGKFQQRAFTPHKPPAYRNYLWSGYCTAYVRAQIQNAIRLVGDDAILAITTDGIITKTPLPHIEGSKQLGKWKKEKPDNITIVGAGMYESRHGRCVVSLRTRGVRADSTVHYTNILAFWKRHPYKAWTQKTSLFIGMGLASIVKKYKHKLGHFIETTKQFMPLWAGNEKRVAWILIDPKLTSDKDGFVWVPPRGIDRVKMSKPYDDRVTIAPEELAEEEIQE